MHNKLISRVTGLWKSNWIMVFSVYAFFVVLFAVTFYKTSFFLNFLYSTRIYFFFVLLPLLAYSMFFSEMKFPRFIAFAAAYFAATIILSYYLALFGLNVKYHAFVVPILLLIISYVTAIITGRKKEVSADSEDNKNSESTNK